MLLSIIGTSQTAFADFKPTAAPFASTLGASSTLISNELVVGSVTPNGLDTTVWFQWGTTTNLGNITSTAFVSGTNDTLTITNILSPVVPSLSYHYRIIASNQVGVAVGDDASFTASTFGLADSGIRNLYACSLLAADFDEDGKMDVLINGVDTNFFGFTTVWRNLGGGHFEDWADLDTNNFGLHFSGSYLGGGYLAAGDFFNSGHEDILLTGQIYSVTVAQIWRNRGPGTFSIVSNSALPAIAGFTAVGDFDNDGRLDIVTYNPSQSLAWYRNLGNGVFTNVNSGLDYTRVPTGGGRLFVGDFDNDGYLDIISGYTLWRNLGNGKFTNYTYNPGADTGISSIFGDFNNDGYLDVFTTFLGPFYQNNGNGILTNLHLHVPYPLSDSAGDFNNDGYLDYLYFSSSNVFSGDLLIELNQAGTNFITGPPVGHMPPPVIVCANFGGAGRTDVMMAGAKPEFPVPAAQLWLNYTATSNTPPTSPTNLTAQVMNHGGVRLGWGAATDDHTPQKGLSYNIRVGTSPGGFDIVSPEADAATGFRRVVRLGNAQERLFSLLTNLNSGTYYWSVQAIDTSFAGGPFAAEGSFVIPPVITGSSRTVGGQFQVNFNGHTGASYTLQASTNLTEWTLVVTSITTNDGPSRLVDTNSANYAVRYYRLRSP